MSLYTELSWTDKTTHSEVRVSACTTLAKNPKDLLRILESAVARLKIQIREERNAPKEDRRHE